MQPAILVYFIDFIKSSIKLNTMKISIKYLIWGILAETLYKVQKKMISLQFKSKIMILNCFEADSMLEIALL